MTELQSENESLKALARLANQYTRTEFGMNVKELHEALWKLETYERKAKERRSAQQGQPVQRSNATATGAGAAAPGLIDR